MKILNIKNMEKVTKMKGIHELNRLLEDTLRASRIPVKEVKCYGSQIVVTCWCEQSARKYADLIAKFANLRSIKESLDEKAKNRQARLSGKYVKVWRVYATI